MQFSVSLYIHILPHKKIWGQSKLLKYRNNSQKLPRSLENWPKSIRIRISLCFLTKSLPNAFGKDLVKKQRKILMMINFGGCEGVSANYFDILKASIDLKFFCEQGYGCVGWPKIALEWFLCLTFAFRNFGFFCYNILQIWCSTSSRARCMLLLNSKNFAVIEAAISTRAGLRVMFPQFLDRWHPSPVELHRTPGLIPASCNLESTRSALWITSRVDWCQLELVCGWQMVVGIGGNPWHACIIRCSIPVDDECILAGVGVYW